MMKYMIVAAVIVVSGGVAAVQEVSPPSIAGPVDAGKTDLDERVRMRATRLAQGEFAGAWSRFRIGTTMLFTDRAIEMDQQERTLVDNAAPGEALPAMIRDFTDATWTKVGAELGRMTVANGIDSGSDWTWFAWSARDQLIQRILAGDNNWPRLGEDLSDQAMAVVRSRHDEQWQRFGEEVGQALEIGPAVSWRQWGLQVGVQARSRRGDPRIDWSAFGQEIANQARSLAENLVGD